MWEKSDRGVKENINSIQFNWSTDTNIPGAPSTPSEEIVVFDPGDYSEQEADSDENIAQQDNIVQQENVDPKSENSNLAEARTEYNIAVFKRLFFKKFKSLYYISQDGHWKDQIHTNSKCRHQDFLSQNAVDDVRKYFSTWAAPRDT